MRLAIERVNSEQKDSLGARSVIVNVSANVFTHLLFGGVIVTIKHLLELL